MRFGEFKSITINNKTVKTIELDGDIVYPRRKTITIQFNWNDVHNWDNLRPLSFSVRVNRIIGTDSIYFGEYILSDSNNWSVSFTTSLDYEFELATISISRYTVNVVESNNTFTVNCTHAVITESTSITLSTTDSLLESYPVNIYVDNVLYESGVEVNGNGYSFVFPKYSQGSYQTLTTVSFTYESSESHQITLSGDVDNGFVLTMTPYTGTLIMRILVDLSETSYPNDLENIRVRLSDMDSRILKIWEYNDFSIGTYGSYTMLQLSEDIRIGSYNVGVLNASGLIRDCELSGNSIADYDVVLESQSDSYITLFLEYVLPEEEEEE